MRPVMDWMDAVATVDDAIEHAHLSAEYEIVVSGDAIAVWFTDPREGDVTVANHGGIERERLNTQVLRFLSGEDIDE